MNSSNYLIWLQKIVLFGMPVILIVAEAILREGHTDTQEFIAPTLASVGIGLILPLAMLKNRSKEKGVFSASAPAVIHAFVSWIALVVATIFWTILLVRSFPDALSQKDMLFDRNSVWSGLGVYCAGMILDLLKVDEAAI